MPTSAERGDDRWAVDTSVAIAALDATHAAHAECRQVVSERRPRLSGHAAFETVSVLTRMPGTRAIAPSDALDLVNAVFPDPLWLSTADTADLYGRLRTLGISGGAVYDALVGSAATAHGHRLLTRDLRARRTYDLLGVDTVYLG